MSQEFERAIHLKKALAARGMVPDDYLEDGYKAIGIHSNSTIFVCNQALADLTGYSI